MMADWFYAAGGKQQGPYPEPQFRELIGRQVVGPDTLVWTNGMPGWQKAVEIPGLLGGDGGPPTIPAPGTPAINPGSGAGGALSVDFSILEFTWRSLVLLIGTVFVIPAPWVFVWYTRWIVSCVHVPGRPNLGFSGRATTLLPWYFGYVVLLAAIGWSASQSLNTLVLVVQFVLYWLLLKWLIANITSNGQSLGLHFAGTFWAYLGWNVLLFVSFVTIIGWAWVMTAQMRWFCGNIEGTRRAVVFRGSGLEFLWRSIVAAILSSFIIPIPWMYRWMMNWMASQTDLVPRGSV
jgi:hypothetical protein